jgi:hypothetical protein
VVTISLPVHQRAVCAAVAVLVSLGYFLSIDENKNVPKHLTPEVWLVYISPSSTQMEYSSLSLGVNLQNIVLPTIGKLRPVHPVNLFSVPRVIDLQADTKSYTQSAQVLDLSTATLRAAASEAVATSPIPNMLSPSTSNTLSDKIANSAISPCRIDDKGIRQHKAKLTGLLAIPMLVILAAEGRCVNIN